ncbi:MAG: 50S ribosomal protein L10 [Candidatus Lindowbacteria bacterium RIFCSPLOWO2_12_FULL_62_27]|nr:MAG: 50S ribosomal protein L10 [Candidatus Lindowbacteria bacterium RIFCSPLOWO2_02_FULL_62_12]OGH62779.1 MAG: 50S ribosomal protein L10 [Candidatus Lindowbacteria bacterium RIFCSPLOWO2_12_FULL_62_27]
MPGESKRWIVSQLSEKLSKADGVILAQYQGLTVLDLTRLRMKLRQIQGELRILQNRLTKIALKEIPGAAPLTMHLKGPTAAVFCFGDPVALAKALKEFSDEREAFRVKAGFVSGRYLESVDVARLAALPSRPALLGQTVGLIASPLRRLVTVLSQPQRALVQVLGQVARKKS